ncbi:rCG28392 [Rattus norvegicus]|uniref:RCG28392 n=1 Tax=Rattus norvegicus TaxID=10116 RepID=A6HUQ4_RAT|nr:rCG28392 [Rattus norvegicus]
MNGHINESQLPFKCSRYGERKPMDDTSNFIPTIHPGRGNRFPFYRSELSRSGLRNQLS